MVEVQISLFEFAQKYYNPMVWGKKTHNLPYFDMFSSFLPQIEAFQKIKALTNDSFILNHQYYLHLPKGC